MDSFIAAGALRTPRHPVSGSRSIRATQAIRTLLCAALVSCGGDTSAPPVTQPPPPPPPPPPPAVVASISVDRPAATLVVGGRVQLVVTARDAGGAVIENPQVTWFIQGSSAVVTAQGMVTATRLGTTQVTARSNGHEAQTAISVIAGDASRNILTAPVGEIGPGDTVRYSYVSIDANGLARSGPVQWTTSSASVATVDADGLVRGVGAGNTSISASIAGHTAASPLSVLPDVPVAAIAASKTAVCAIRADGALFCAGQGHGLTAQPVAPQLRFSAIEGFGASGFDSTSGFCAIATDGRAYCWGTNQLGQLGTGDLLGRAEPAAVAGGIRFQSVRPGSTHTCGLDLDGIAWCWGSRGERGSGLGHGGDAGSLVPVRVSTDLTFTQIATGTYFTCALTAAGEAYCWGRNGTGQLGNANTPHESMVPLPVSGGLRFRGLSHGATALMCGVTLAGEPFCWGNTNPLASAGGQQCPFFDGGTHPCWPVPTRIQTTRRFSLVIANNFAGVCGLGDDGQVACWGMNDMGRFGIPNDLDSCIHPNGGGGCTTPMAGPAGFVSLAGSVATNCGITPQRRAFCWGDGRDGRMTVAVPAASVTVPVRFRIPAAAP
jgi:alpha-tubulin suppressor-like RCC1 family protein